MCLLLCWPTRSVQFRTVKNEWYNETMQVRWAWWKPGPRSNLVTGQSRRWSLISLITQTPSDQSLRSLGYLVAPRGPDWAADLINSVLAKHNSELATEGCSKYQYYVLSLYEGWGVDKQIDMIGKRMILANAIKADEQQHVKLCPLKANLCLKDLNHVRLSTVLPFNPLEICPWVWSRVAMICRRQNDVSRLLSRDVD